MHFDDALLTVPPGCRRLDCATVTPFAWPGERVLLMWRMEFGDESGRRCARRVSSHPGVQPEASAASVRASTYAAPAADPARGGANQM
jgi:hypothetical protein